MKFIAQAYNFCNKAESPDYFCSLLLLPRLIMATSFKPCKGRSTSRKEIQTA